MAHLSHGIVREKSGHNIQKAKQRPSKVRGRDRLHTKTDGQLHKQMPTGVQTGTL